MRDTTDGGWRLGERMPTDGGVVAYDVLGSGPPVVLVHGTPTWSYIWRRVAARLAGTHTVYVWDLLGYGDSETAPGVSPSIRLHARTLAELAGRWGIGAADVAGHDIGGAAVLRAHLLHGLPLRRLALIDAVALAPFITPASRHMRDHLECYRTMPLPVFAALIAAHLDTATARPLPDDVRARYLDRFAGEPGRARWLDHVAHFDEDDTRAFEPALARIDVPTRVLWGDRDAWLAPADGRLTYPRPSGAGAVVREGELLFRIIPAGAPGPRTK